MGARSARILGVLIHPSRGSTCSTPCAASPRQVGLSLLARADLPQMLGRWSTATWPRAALGARITSLAAPPTDMLPCRSLGHVLHSRLMLSGLASWRASSIIVAIGSLQALVDLNLVVNAKGLPGMITVDGIEGPLAMRGVTKCWMITLAMPVSHLAMRRLSAAAYPRGTPHLAPRLRLLLPLAFSFR